tara:strand:- start:56 stop:262 length:207 start_codon:yes stop_codon:yes gene_type:complete
MKISRQDLRSIILETWESVAREATPEEMEYLERLKGIRRSREPGQSLESRIDKLEVKVDAILDMIGEM